MGTTSLSQSFRDKGSSLLQSLQRIGKALLFPIAMLPFAAIFLRIGAAVPQETEFSTLIGSLFSGIGSAVFDNLHILFAIGVAFGLSKDSRGEAAIVGFLIITLSTILLSNSGPLNLVDKIYGNIDFGAGIPITDTDNANIVIGEMNGFQSIFTPGKFNAIIVGNVLNGIFIGGLVAWVYNSFNGIELPSVLGFFSGRRLIPVLGLIFGTLFIIAWAIIFPWVGWAIYEFSDALGSATGNRYGNAAVMGVYGFINRLLIPFGLHHIPNTLFWFQLGSYDVIDSTGAITDTINGDINIFLEAPALNNTAGTFQSGFFPIMMFGLPTLALAFWYNAEGEVQKSRVASLLFGSAIVSFFTGITEPIEFSFMFLSPGIYLMHAILTGVWGFIVGLFGIQLGFGFSAGLIDFALSIPKSLEIISVNKSGIDAVMANPFWLFPIGLATSASYFFGATILIKKFNVRAPGRGEDKLQESSQENSQQVQGALKYENDARKIIVALDQDNIQNVEWCATRLRFTLKSNENVDENLIKQTMSRGIMKIGNSGLQIIIGPTVEMIGNTINTLLSNDEKITLINSNQNIEQDSQKDNKKQETNNKKLNVSAYSPCSGTLHTLASLKDGVFSEKILGDGLVIDSSDGNVYSPFDGNITMVFNTKHAYGITSKDGINILIHIGLDTVSLNGEGFHSYIKEGQKVKKGDKIASFDKEFIESKKLNPSVIMVITSDSKYEAQEIKTKGNVDSSIEIMKF